MHYHDWPAQHKSEWGQFAPCCKEYFYEMDEKVLVVEQWNGQILVFMHFLTGVISTELNSWEKVIFFKKNF